MRLNRTEIADGMLLVGLGLAGILEAIRLAEPQGLQTSYDLLGPANYLLAIGVALIIIGSVHAGHAMLTRIEEQRESTRVELNRKVLLIVGALLIYAALLSYLGYALSTLLFFIVAFKIMGVRTWLSTLWLGVLVTGLYYVVFVLLCNMVFPRGIL